ncbi:MAG: succinylglutamate desuccinylase/aspartoacylase family protein [Methanobacterium sp.]|uniref:succinylglutamate desuccinylase n=1 Tax=Methanobacterium sp. TaxID=2164 RepID=UPI003D6585EA|nr:succinylglutamate desuccinylase/aspartoacylase family protein [Methanobacterium sp.]
MNNKIPNRNNLIIFCFLIILAVLTILLTTGILDLKGIPSPEIEVINNSASGDITKNTLIMENIPKTELNIEIIKKANYGAPIIKLGEGNPKVMIIAGVHGEELPPQIASLKLINDLKDKKLKGTIYIIPFAVPESTEKNIRDFQNKDPNRETNSPNSPTNVVLQFAKDNNINYVGDFHSTRPDGVPGKKVVMCSKEINYESFKLAEFISQKTNSDIFLKPENEGTVNLVFNSNGIPTISAEVVSQHGQVNLKDVDASYDQMYSLLIYSRVL